MVKRNIRYITRIDDQFEEQFFAFEVGISLIGTEVRDALFAKVQELFPEHNEKEINAALDKLAYEGLSDLGNFVLSTDDVACYAIN